MLLRLAATLAVLLLQVSAAPTALDETQPSDGEYDDLYCPCACEGNEDEEGFSSVWVAETVNGAYDPDAEHGFAAETNTNYSVVCMSDDQFLEFLIAAEDVVCDDECVDDLYGDDGFQDDQYGDDAFDDDLVEFGEEEDGEDEEEDV